MGNPALVEERPFCIEEYWRREMTGFAASFGYRARMGSIMSTAIVSPYTREGFVIGADGMRRDQRTGKVLDLKAQKIFLVEDEKVRLAYAWAGVTHLLDPQDQPVFVFANETASAASNARAHGHFGDYVTALCKEIVRNLVRVQRSGRLSHGLPTARRTELGEEQIAQLLLVGYFRGRPCRARVQVNHVAQTLIEPAIVEIHDGSVPSDFCMFSGSVEIYDQMVADGTMTEPKSLQDAAKLTRDYLQRCINNQNRLEDCRDIGGHIHIAAITPGDFRWIVAPEQDQP